MASSADQAAPGVIAAFCEPRPKRRAELRRTSWTAPSAGLADTGRRARTTPPEVEP